MGQTIDSKRILRFRALGGHLLHRLPEESIAEGAYPGLQDSAPRSGILSLHARVDGLQPASWDDPALAQVWGPRGAVYIVPRKDVHVFTLGRLPRDPKWAARLEKLAGQVCTVVGDGMMRSGDVSNAVGVERPADIRWSAVAGTFGIRWDCQTTTVYRLPPPTIDPDEARLELARRFLSVLGPGSAQRYARWAGITDDDADATFARLSGELVDVGGRWILERDGDRWRSDEAIEGVRLLPMGDHFLYADRPLLVSNKARWDQLFRATGSLAGAILVDGEVAGTWQRQQGKVTMRPWQPISDEHREAAEREANAFPLDVAAITVTWADEMSH